MRRLLLVLIVLLSVPLSAQQPANCPLGGMVVSADNTAWACRGTASPPIQVTTGAGTASGTNTGDQTITLTGGVTGSGTGSFAATVVTNANLTGAVTSAGNATSYATAVPFSLGGIGACAATSATTARRPSRSRKPRRGTQRPSRRTRPRTSRNGAGCPAPSWPEMSNDDAMSPRADGDAYPRFAYISA